MKRADITELFPEAPKEAIDKLMALNGADVNAAKAEVEDLRKQLQAAREGDGKLQEAQQQIAQLTSELDGMKKAETIRLTREKVAGEKKIPANLRGAGGRDPRLRAARRIPEAAGCGRAVPHKHGPDPRPLRGLGKG